MRNKEDAWTMGCGNCNNWSRKGRYGPGFCSKKYENVDARLKHRGSDQGGCWEPKAINKQTKGTGE